MTNTDPVYQAAIKTFGYQHQVLMLFEEMAELQNALCKLSRGRASASDVVTEIADVMIMCRQMALYFDPGAVEREIQRKTDRLYDRIYDEAAKKGDNHPSTDDPI